jgi:hypothetical protein
MITSPNATEARFGSVLLDPRGAALKFFSQPAQDSVAVNEHVEKAKKTAGTEWPARSPFSFAKRRARTTSTIRSSIPPTSRWSSSHRGTWIILAPRRAFKSTTDGLQQYLHAIAHFKDETKKARWTWSCRIIRFTMTSRKKLDELKAPKKGDPNPFVVGQANYQKFLDVMSQCMDAQIARRKE